MCIIFLYFLILKRYNQNMQNEKEIQSVFGDEAGITGYDLLNPTQPIFTYATLAIEENEAQKIVQLLHQKFKIQSPELKGATICKRKDWPKIYEIINNRVSGKYFVVVADKKYALCCKMFEYIFEGVLSEKNSILYSFQFHKFIATLFYYEVNHNYLYSKDLLSDMQNYLHFDDPSSLNTLGPSSRQVV